MSIFELFFLAIWLSMDAFAAAVCVGLAMPRASIQKSLIVGLYFGLFQAFMPLAGYMVAALFTDRIMGYGHYAAFGLLCFLGLKMIVESRKKYKPSEKAAISLGPARMLPLAVATSVDALAAGVLFAFLGVSIVPAVSIIGLTTLAISMTGVKIGHVFGVRFKSKAEFIGGLILILLGFKILFEHLDVI